MVIRKVVIEPCKELWRKYENALERKPLITKSILSGFLFFSGDIIAQGVERRFLDKQPKSPTWMGIEWERAAQLTAFGVLLNGPALHWWYRFLDRRFGAGTGWKNVFKKVAADQFAFAPGFYVGFLGTMPLLQDTLNYDTLRWIQGKPPVQNNENNNNNNDNQVGVTSLFRQPSLRKMFDYEKEKFVNSLQTSFFSTLFMDYRIWPFANVINFGFVPAEQRVLFSSAVYIGWNAYLSNVVNGHGNEDQDGGNFNKERVEDQKSSHSSQYHQNHQQTHDQPIHAAATNSAYKTDSNTTSSGVHDADTRNDGTKNTVQNSSSYSKRHSPAATWE